MLSARTERDWRLQYDLAQQILSNQGGDAEEAAQRVAALEIELPSWGFGRGGTRFGVYTAGEEARDVEERLADCALVHRLTAATPAVATHFPWDGAGVDEARTTLAAIRRHGLRPGPVNSNVFSTRPTGPLDARLRYGSLTNPWRDVRRASVEHHLECLEIARLFESSALSVWLPDGTNSPGQLSFFEQADWLEETLAEIYEALRPGERMLIEYKFFEPAFYATAVPDWGRAYTLAARLGEQAAVLVDLGHHAQGTNIEQVVAHLIRLGKFGGFHFNDRKYADDDLATGSLDPAQLFRIFVTLVDAERRGLLRLADVSFGIDQSHNVKNPIEEMIESADAVQRAFAQALTVDWRGLEEARSAGDATRGDQLLREAFGSPVADGLLWRARQRQGAPADPLAALRASGELESRRSRRAAPSEAYSAR